MSIPFTTQVTMIDAVSANTTSVGYDISKRQQVVVEFICANHSSGNGVFSIDGTADGSNWVTGIACQNSQATASTTYITTVTLSANGAAAVYVPTGWKEIRANVVFSTDGKYTVVMHNG